MVTVRSITRELKERSAEIAETLLFRDLATPEELEAYQPGGKENSDTGTMGVVFYYATMVRMCERIRKIPERADTARAATESEIADALRGAPEYVTLAGLSLKGDPTIVAVYPKGYDCLDWLALRDAEIKWLIEQRQKLIEQAIPVDVDLIDVVSRGIAYLYGLIVHAITSPGPWLPWGDGEPPEELPEDCKDMNPLDVVRIHAAFVRVNQLRLAGLSALLNKKHGDEATKRPSWLSFLATQAAEHGADVKLLMRNRDLPSLIATALVAAEVRQQAIEAAKAKEKAA